MKHLLRLILFLPNFLVAQQGDIDSLDWFIQKQVNDYKIPGLAIGVIKDNSVLFKKGYGTTSNESGLPVTTQTVFPILSCTKAFTAAVIGILVDRGKLKWNDKVIKYLPGFKLSDQKITEQLTISDILSHRSGLETFEGDLLWYGTDYSREEVVRRMQYSPVRNKFRSDFGYQNVMYLVAGLIVEKVTGQTWDDFIKKEIFLPLSMTKTSTSVDALLQERSYAHPHLLNKPIPLVNMHNIGPAGSINSNIEDLLNWLQLWLDGGYYRGQRILTNATYQAITSDKIKVAKNSKESYGYGWFVATEKKRKVLSHSGGMPGYKSLIVILPQSKTAIVILTNKISYINEQLAGTVTDYLIAKSINWKEADKKVFGKNFRFAWDEERDTSHQAFIAGASQYEGVYEDEAYGKAVIGQKDGQTILTLLPSKEQFTGPLYYVAKDKLKIIFKDGFVPAGEVLFYRDKDQAVKGFKLNIESSDFHFKYLDFKRKETDSIQNDK